MRGRSLLLAAMLAGVCAGWMPATPLRAAVLLSRCPAPRAMFSGIVEEMGRIRSLEKVTGLELWDGSVGEGWEMDVEASEVLDQASLGCSIAVNGVCLTATKLDPDSFTVGLAPETLEKSNLDSLAAGQRVNLERALPVDARNSGHFVQGHVDDVGEILKMEQEGDALRVRVRPPARLLPYIVPKGFIAVDGTSLTVCEVDAAGGWFDFMLVAYTQQKFVIPKKSVGETVNLEVDVLAKYVEKGLASLMERVAALEAKLQ